MNSIHSGRVQVLHKGTTGRGPVIYWMSRDQRVKDNWALLYAGKMAEELDKPLIVAFTLVPGFPGATIRQYGFMLKGLQEVEKDLSLLGMPFVLLQGDPPAELARFIRETGASFLVRDFDPLRIKREWAMRLSENTYITVITVDAHNIVPACSVSTKAEFGAYTLRPKIRRKLEEFLTAYPALTPWKSGIKMGFAPVNWASLASGFPVDPSVPECEQPEPGEKAAHRAMHDFIRNRLPRYASEKNDPNSDAVSGLSPYLHFGQISGQRIALEILKDPDTGRHAAAFLEELIVRKELSDNFCLYNPEYDRFSGLPAWARKTLDEHRRDEREYLYSPRELEGALTHEPLWNAAQMELTQTGKMHGYLRMYWAKKILEWTRSPEEAMETAIYLNDRYALDGRDSNGYTGIAWSIGGVHDRAWGERPVFGKIRYMNYNGCRRKFDVDAYIRNSQELLKKNKNHDKTSPAPGN